MLVLDALRPREDGDLDVHVFPSVAFQEEGELVFIAPVEELLGRVAVDVGGRTQAAQHIDQVDPHHFLARRAVHDREDGVVAARVMVDEARGHKVGMGDAIVIADIRRVGRQRLARRGPSLIRSVYQ